MGARLITVWMLGTALAGCGDDEASDSSQTSSSSGTTGSTASSGGEGGAGGDASSSSGGGGSTSSTGGAAAEPDFSCEGMPWPSTAPDPLQMGGTVYDSISAEPLAGATVTVLAIADDATLATITSDPQGAYTVSLPTAGAALAIYTRVDAPGYVTSYAYPPYAFWKDEPTRNLPAVSIRDRAAVAAELGATLDPASGTLVLNARDCSGEAVEGATISLSPEAEVTGYVDDTGAHPGDTTSSEGLLIAINVAAGPQEASVAFSGHEWRPWPIRAFADSMVYTPRRP